METAIQHAGGLICWADGAKRGEGGWDWRLGDIESDFRFETKAEAKADLERFVSAQPTGNGQAAAENHFGDYL